MPFAPPPLSTSPTFGRCATDIAIVNNIKLLVISIFLINEEVGIIGEIVCNYVQI